MDALPLFHKLKGCRCLVVGGGSIAQRKLHQLLAAGAEVHLVAPQISDEIQRIAADCDHLALYPRKFAPDDLDGAVLVVVATDNHALNAEISTRCRERCTPVNVVDSPALCTVTFPSIIDRSPLQIAISSGGRAPVLARMLRTRLESSIPASYGRLAAFAGRFRDAVKQKFSNLSDRRYFWESVLEGDIAELVFNGQTALAEQRLQETLASQQATDVGEVYLVGAGPGDPDLLTFRALRLMQKADIVLYDRLVSKEVLALVRRDAELVYVGKTAGNHPVSQENINAKLVEYARQGHRVLRLKGGDPFIFGRGGEEIAHLREAGISFQVVPGITAASGCASYAGIPLTHRDYAQSVRFITGHQKDGVLDLCWQELSRPGQTLVFYMGLNGMETISRELIAHGMSPSMPAALVEKGTTARQRVYTASIASLPELARESGASAPTLIIVGEVVALREQLSWFEGAVGESNQIQQLTRINNQGTPD